MDDILVTSVQTTECGEPKTESPTVPPPESFEFKCVTTPQDCPPKCLDCVWENNIRCEAEGYCSSDPLSDYSYNCPNMNAGSATTFFSASNPQGCYNLCSVQTEACETCAKLRWGATCDGYCECVHGTCDEGIRCVCLCMPFFGVDFLSPRFSIFLYLLKAKTVFFIRVFSESVYKCLCMCVSM